MSLEEVFDVDTLGYFGSQDRPSGSSGRGGKTSGRTVPTVTLSHRYDIITDELTKFNHSDGNLINVKDKTQTHK